MKRTPLRRKTPMKRQRKPLPKRSESMKEKWVLYEAAKLEWRREREIKDGFKCQCISVNSMERCRKNALPDPHHMAFRGKNLAKPEFFLAVCADHHRWIHDNPREAEERGYIVRQYGQK